MSGNSELLSIGIPVFNGKDEIARAIRAAVESEYRPLEVIVSDNASEDGTSDLIADLAREHPEVQHHRSPTTVPLTDNWNRVFHLSSGEFFKWAPHDDYYTPDFVAEAISKLEADPEGVAAYAHTVFVTEKGAPFGVTDDPAPGVIAPTPRARVQKAMRGIRSYPSVMEGVIRRRAMENSVGLPNIEPIDRLRVAELAMMGNIHLMAEPILVVQIPEDRVEKDEWVYNDPANADRLRLRLFRIERAFSECVDHFTDDRRLRIELKSALAYSFLRRKLVKAYRRPSGEEDLMATLRRFVDAVPTTEMPEASARFAAFQRLDS